MREINNDKFVEVLSCEQRLKTLNQKVFELQRLEEKAKLELESTKQKLSQEMHNHLQSQEQVEELRLRLDDGISRLR